MESQDKILKLINLSVLPERHYEAVNYLHKLRYYKIDNLKKDTVNLEDDLNNIDLQTQEIAFSNYQAFIKTADSSRQVLKGWNETTKNVENLIDKIPDFTRSCDEFVKTSYGLSTSNRLNYITMKKHIELLEILELPQLMELSIREEKYADALELASYVEKLSAKFDNIPIVNDVVSTIKSSWQVMIGQLLSELKCDLSLPKCLKVVGYLKRMQAFSPVELKFKFIQTRDCFFSDLLASIPKNDPFQHLVKTIEVTRVNLFNIITQYKALFDDDFNKDMNSKVDIMFCSWIHDKIEVFLDTLNSDLNNSTCSILDIVSILGQCMYFGVSFSRIGIDFRAQTAPVFINIITIYFGNATKRATKQLERDMEGYTLINKDIKPTKRNVKVDIESYSHESHKENAPPESLLDFQPLAIYCNALINIFNELQVCAPLAILNSVIVALEYSLLSASKEILNFYRSEQQAFGTKEKENFFRLCSCFAFEFIPFIQKSINIIFLSNNKLTFNLGSISQLKTCKILESIEHLLPDQYKTTKI